MNDLDTMIGTTQKRITYLYIALFAICLISLLSVVFIRFWIPDIDIPDSISTILIQLLGVLTALITMQSQFWFARSRGGGVPDPTPPIVKPEE